MLKHAHSRLVMVASLTTAATRLLGLFKSCRHVLILNIWCHNPAEKWIILGTGVLPISAPLSHFATVVRLDS